MEQKSTLQIVNVVPRVPARPSLSQFRLAHAPLQFEKVNTVLFEKADIARQALNGSYSTHVSH